MKRTRVPAFLAVAAALAASGCANLRPAAEAATPSAAAATAGAAAAVPAPDAAPGRLAQPAAASAAARASTPGKSVLLMVSKPEGPGRVNGCP